MHLSDAFTSDFGPASECGPSQLYNDVAFPFSSPCLTLTAEFQALTEQMRQSLNRGRAR